jgi:hypothetical protein
VRRALPPSRVLLACVHCHALPEEHGSPAPCFGSTGQETRATVDAATPRQALLSTNSRQGILNEVRIDWGGAAGMDGVSLGASSFAKASADRSLRSA